MSRPPASAQGSSRPRSFIQSPAISGTPGPSGTSTPVTTDIYRPIAAAVQKPIASLLEIGASSGSANLPALLGLDASTYSSRLSGKNVLLADLPSSGPSALVQGKKRHRGDPEAKRKVREAQLEAERIRKEKGMEGIRRSRKKVACTGPGSVVDYNTLLPLHYLFLRYMTQLLALPPLTAIGAPPTPTGKGNGPTLLPGVTPEGLQSKVIKADLTGARLKVLAAKNASLVGISGLVLEETAGTFNLVGSDSTVRVIPKVGSQFTLTIPAYAPDVLPSGEVDMQAHAATSPQIELDILGSAFAFRSGDRAGRKFRPAQGNGGGSGWGEEWIDAEWGNVLGKLDHGEDKAMVNRRRKRNKHRRKDPVAQGSLVAF